MTIARFAKIGILAGLCAAGCSSSSDGSSGTTGRLIALKTQAQVKDDLMQAKTNALGWSVTIAEAYLSVGPLYYYSGDPVLSQRPMEKSLLRYAFSTVGDWLVKPAQAHPGHYIEGAAMGQMLTPTTLDLLAGTIPLADGDGVTGDTNSAKFTWQSPPQGELAPALEGHVVLTKGVATKGDTTIHFIAKADEAEVRDGDDKAEVAGCAFGPTPGAVGVNMDGGGTVTLALVPGVWFDQVDFSYVAPGADGAPTADANGAIDIAGTLAWEGFVRGVKKGTGYEFAYTK
jgi:hypothetical protein